MAKRKRKIISNGTKVIKALLLAKKISFKQEHKIPECKNIRPLSFDFAIFKEKQLLALIEYNGIQHYQKVRKFGGKKAFVSQQKRDQIKRDFCAEKQIPFLEIAYWDFEKIEEMLDEFFSSFHKN